MHLLKNLSILSVMLISNIGAILAIKLTVGEKLDIIWKIDSSFLAFGLILYIIMTMAIAYSFRVVFGVNESNIYYYSSFIGIVFGLGGTFFAAIKSVLNVVIYDKDTIFENKLFKINYIYDKTELYNLLDTYYLKYHGKKGPLSEDTKEILLNKINTVSELQIAVKELINTENSTAKMSSIFNGALNSASYIINFYISHPIIAGSVTTISVIGLGLTFNYLFGFAAVWSTMREMNIGARATERGLEDLWVAIRETKTHLKDLIVPLNLTNEYFNAMLKFTVRINKALVANIGMLAANDENREVIANMYKLTQEINKVIPTMGHAVVNQSTGLTVFGGTGYVLGGTLGRESSRLLNLI